MSDINDEINAEEDEHKLTLRHLRLEDYPDIKEIMDTVYDTMDIPKAEKNLKRK